MTSKQLVAALNAGTRANFDHPLRKGNMICLPGPGRVVMSGDLHNHRRNFERLIKVAELDASPRNHLILHEIIHSGEGNSIHCNSYRMVAEGAQLVHRYPGQVHYMLGNHAMAQISRDEVLKNGQPMVKALRDGAHHEFGVTADEVLKALDEFILSMPIAIRTENRIWMSHSLPTKRNLKTFDDGIFNKQLTQMDMNLDPSLRALCWDRRQDAEVVETLRGRWDVDHFIVGHQKQETGYGRPHEHMIILASDHNHGCCLPFDLGTAYTGDTLADCIKPLAAIA